MSRTVSRNEEAGAGHSTMQKISPKKESKEDQEGKNESYRRRDRGQTNQKNHSKLMSDTRRGIVYEILLLKHKNKRPRRDQVLVFR